MMTDYDVAVVGGGPAGATAAETLARTGHRVLLLERGGRIKPCGGAIPTRAIRDFALPQSLLTARVGAARIISPKGCEVEMEIGDIGYVGMVDRDVFDPWLRERAGEAGADVVTGTVKTLERTSERATLTVETDEGLRTPTVRVVIGADGANSAVRRAAFGPNKKPRYVFAYHEIVESPPAATAQFKPDRCDVIYRGEISPDFYGWVFPHGPHSSVGCGSAVKGHSLRRATERLRDEAGLADAKTVRREGAPLPLKPLRRWDDGHSVILAGDAAGVVAPSSGEGIYYAMLSGQYCAEAAIERLATGRVAALRTARKRFMREHGKVFFILGMMQAVWYRNDRLREKFVKMCADPDVQRLTWESYLNKRLVRRDPMAHIRVFFKDMGQLLGVTGRT